MREREKLRGVVCNHARGSVLPLLDEINKELVTEVEALCEK